MDNYGCTSHPLGNVTRAPERAAIYDRRAFLKSFGTIAAAAELSLLDLRLAAAGPVLETTRLRLVHSPAICFAPQYLAETFLRAEGFTDIEYVAAKDRTSLAIVAAGEGEFTLDAVRTVLTGLDAGDPLVALAGVHLGCYELFGTSRVHAIRDLKGKTVPVWAMGSDQQIFLASMAAYVGLDPNKDINWIVRPPKESMRLLNEGKVDAYLGFPPDPQELKANKIGHVVVNTTTDKPWSQYFCCMMVGNRHFVEQHPVATKRALRALLKATDLCAQDPERAARFIVDKKYTPRYDHAVEALKEVSYDAWRQYDPEAAMRFYALRLHDVGMIKSNPQKLIAQGTDWRFLNELKKELKA